MWEPSPSLLSSSSSSSPSLNASLKILLLLTSHIFAGISELQITHKCVCVHLPRLCPRPLSPARATCKEAPRRRVSRSSVFHGVMVLEPRDGLCVRSLSRGRQDGHPGWR